MGQVVSSDVCLNDDCCLEGEGYVGNRTHST